MTKCKYDLFHLWSSRSSWRTRWLIPTLYLWCRQMSQVAIASHCRWKESFFQEEQMGGMLLRKHIKCGACLEYFVWLLPLSDVFPVLIDLHNTRQPQDQYKPWVSDLTCRTELICEVAEWSATSTPSTLWVQTNSCCCQSFFTSPGLNGWTCTVPGINVN